MKTILEMLWDDYFSEKCSAIESDEEKALIKNVAKQYEEASALLNKEQQQAIEKHLEVLCDLEAHFIKKAFFKGCQFAIAFFSEAVSEDE